MTNHSTPGLNSIECYGGRWPDHDVHPDEPTWIYYEVDTVADVVLRTVNVFADGRIERNSIALEERNQRSSFCWNGRRMYPRNPFPTEKLQE